MSLVEKLENMMGIKVRTPVHLLQSSAEITKRRRTDESLREENYLTTDFFMCRLENGEPVLYITGLDGNLILKNINKASRQLKKIGYYLPEQREIDEVVALVESRGASRFEYSKLGLEEGRTVSEECLIVIDPSAPPNYGLNKRSRKVAEIVYGEGIDFVDSMAMLAKERIIYTDITLPSPKYIKEHVKEGGALAHYSVLLNFATFGSSFCATSSDISKGTVSLPSNIAMKQVSMISLK